MQHDPVRQFEIWYEDALEAQAKGLLKMPDAMALATATPEGRPSSRMVLYKGLSGGGVTFHTNFGSRKCREIFANPQGALLFYWSGIDRQIRIEGRIEKLSDEESDRYWSTRNRESNIGAWASHQSAPVADRGALIREVDAVRERFASEAEVPRPEFWGGFRLVPDEFEFWKAGEHRLHDRIRYRRAAASREWSQTRLSP